MNVIPRSLSSSSSSSNDINSISTKHVCRIWSSVVSLGGFTLDMLRIVEENPPSDRLMPKDELDNIGNNNDNHDDSDDDNNNNEAKLTSRDNSMNSIAQSNISIAIIPAETNGINANANANAKEIAINNNINEHKSNIINKSNINKSNKNNKNNDDNDVKSINSFASSRSSAMGYKQAMNQLRRLFLSQNVGLSSSMWWLRFAFIATILMIVIFAVVSLALSKTKQNVYASGGIFKKKNHNIILIY